MTHEAGAFTARLGSLWIFPEGPNRPGEYMGCIDVGDISEPGGDVSLIQCFGPDGEFMTLGEMMAAPGPVTVDLTQLTHRSRTWLERLKGEYGIILLQRDNGYADVFSNWKRALILRDARNTQRTYGAVLARETENPTTRGFTVSATPPVIQAQPMHGGPLSTAEVEDFHAVYLLKEDWGIYPAQHGIAVCKAAGGAKANVYVSDDAGHSWTVVTAPGGVGENLVACALLDMGNGLLRLLAISSTLNVFISDDGGTTWATIVLPAGGGYGQPQLSLVDSQHIWLACTGGYSYFSGDAGASWQQQITNVVTAEDLRCCHFLEDGLHGFVGGDNGVVFSTGDGGITWAAKTVIASTPDVMAIWALDEDRVWVGCSNGKLYFSEDGGLTWTQRGGWTGSGSNKVQALEFINDWVGFMLVESAAPVGYLLRTIDGGMTWNVLPCATNVGLWSMSAADENYVLAGGEHSATPLGWIGLFEE